MFREVVSIHIGQAGVQVGNAIWELYCAEHAIGQDGYIMEEPRELEVQTTFYQISTKGKRVPRCIFIDLEASVVDEIRVGSWRKLFHPERFITGYEDAANNFARGYFTVGKTLLEPITNQLRRMIESCEAPQGVIIFRSLGGGTGAGLTAALTDVMVDYRKLSRIEIPIYPSPALSNSLVEPYNSLLGEHFVMEDMNIALLMDNEAMYEKCSSYLSTHKITYTKLNRLVAHVTSALTSSVRFPNLLNADFDILQTNLIPYPRIHFPMSNLAPCVSTEIADHQKICTRDLVLSVFERENQLIKVDPYLGKFMSCSLFFRGNVSPRQIYQSLLEIKERKGVDFVDWCPTGFKVGITTEPPVSIFSSNVAQSDKNVVMLANNSAVSQAWQRLAIKFQALYWKRSFVHWYVGEGMEENEFTESLDNILSLISDYEETVGVDKKYN